MVRDRTQRPSLQPQTTGETRTVHGHHELGLSHVPREGRHTMGVSLLCRHVLSRNSRKQVPRLLLGGHAVDAHGKTAGTAQPRPPSHPFLPLLKGCRRHRSGGGNTLSRGLRSQTHGPIPTLTLPSLTVCGLPCPSQETL